MIVCQGACVNQDTHGSSGGYNGSAARPDGRQPCAARALLCGRCPAHTSGRLGTNHIRPLLSITYTIRCIGIHGALVASDMGRHQISRTLTRAMGAVLLFGISYVVSAVMNAATISPPAFVAPQSHQV